MRGNVDNLKDLTAKPSHHLMKIKRLILKIDKFSQIKFA